MVGGSAEGSTRRLMYDEGTRVTYWVKNSLLQMYLLHFKAIKGFFRSSSRQIRVAVVREI